MNFVNTFDELSKLYEAACTKEDCITVEETFNVKNSDGHFSIVQFAKNIHDNLINNKIDCTVSLEDGYKIKVECDNFEGVDDLVRNTKELVTNNMEPDIEDCGKYRLYMLKQKAV
jgi:hypothetical protein